MKKSVSVFKNKKGYIQDMIMIIVFLFVFATSTFFAMVVYNEYRDKTADTMEETEVQKSIVSDAIRTLNIMDYMFLMLFMGLTISTIVTAFFIRSHPVLFVLSIILLFVILILAVTFSNVFEKISQQPSMANATNTYTIIPEIMGKLPLYIFGVFVLVALAFFAKAKMEEGGL